MPIGIVYGHIMLKAPVLVRSLKLNNIELCEYFDVKLINYIEKGGKNIGKCQHYMVFPSGHPSKY